MSAFDFRTLYNSDNVTNPITYEVIKPGDFVNFCEYQRSQYEIPQIHYGFVLWTEAVETPSDYPCSGSQRVFIAKMPYWYESMTSSNTFYEWLKVYVKFKNARFKFSNSSENNMFDENGPKVFKTDAKFGSKHFVTRSDEAEAKNIKFGQQVNITMVHPHQVAKYDIMSYLEFKIPSIKDILSGKKELPK